MKQKTANLNWNGTKLEEHYNCYIYKTFDMNRHLDTTHSNESKQQHKIYNINERKLGQLWRD